MGYLSIMTKLLHALSRDFNDLKLQKEGLKLVGILGFIPTLHLPGTRNFNQFSVVAKRKGKSYLYTTNPPDENFEELEYNNEGSLGEIFTERQPNTVRLYRFFHKESFTHLFITHPDQKKLLDEGYRDESARRPLYLFNQSMEGAKPLYLYSNSNIQLPVFQDRSSTVAGDINFNPKFGSEDFQDILIDEELPLNAFDISYRQNDIQVSMKNSNRYFKVRFESNQIVFNVSVLTLTSNPSITQVNSWNDVISLFEGWLNDIRSNLPNGNSNAENIANLNNAKGIRREETDSDVVFQNDSVKPVLNVGAQVLAYEKLISGFKKGETGLLLGIFGRWGRGKTYFWNQLKKKLQTPHYIHYEFVEFHAWKYQDTPASWAYLYEQFATTYYDRHFFGRVWNWLRLNFNRLGWKNLFFLLAFVVLVVGWNYIVPYQVRQNNDTWSLDLIKYFGLTFFIGVIGYCYRYSGKAIELFDKYLSKSKLANFLGVQAEMQKDLHILLKTWIKKKDVDKKRLVLFVDDIDRCSEDRIIQVIDSLKVMIDDAVVSDRVLVIAAVDEVILKRAIRSKYYESVEREGGDKEKILTRLSREYLDKLFVGGIRLGNLTMNENREVLDNLLEIHGRSQEAPIDGINLKQELSKEPPIFIERKVKVADVPIEPEYIHVKARKDKAVMEHEAEFLLKAIEKFNGATPRAIRIFYYRYHLFKSFKSIMIDNDPQLSNEWLDNEDNKIIMPYLLIQYAHFKTHDDLNAMIGIVQVDEKEMIFVELFGAKFELSKTLYLTLLKIVEIIVPY